MIIGPELRSWAANRDAQRAARNAARQLACIWADGPVHQRFTQAMARVTEGTAEAVSEAARALFADDSWVGHLVGTLADAMRRDPFFEPPFRHLTSDVHSGLIVFEDELVSIAAGVCGVGQLATLKTAKRAGTSVAFSGQVSVIKFVKAGNARLSFWRAPRITEAFNVAAAGRCERVGECHMADGEVLTVDGRFESFVIEQAAGNMLVLQAVAKPDQAPVAAEYDSATGDYLGCSAADDSASRIQMITTLLRKLDCEAAFPAVAEFLAHPNFFVRWHVMRELLGLDLEAALPLLKRMAARDPHAETRRTARITLDRIEGGTAREKAA